MKITKLLSKDLKTLIPFSHSSMLIENGLGVINRWVSSNQIIKMVLVILIRTTQITASMDKWGHLRKTLIGMAIIMVISSQKVIRVTTTLGIQISTSKVILVAGAMHLTKDKSRETSGSRGQLATISTRKTGLTKLMWWLVRIKCHPISLPTTPTPSTCHIHLIPWILTRYLSKNKSTLTNTSSPLPLRTPAIWRQSSVK